MFFNFSEGGQGFLQDFTFFFGGGELKDLGGGESILGVGGLRVIKNKVIKNLAHGTMSKGGCL